MQKRYVGTTDEPLCQKGLELLAGRKYPEAELVFCSPLVRCVETARIIYPDRTLIKVKDFSECDFGEFENKNYTELSGNLKYSEWVESGGILPFPGGETVESFKKRSVEAFVKILKKYAHTKSAAAVVHNGTIMAIMEALSVEKKSYFDWGAECGGGYVLLIDKYFRLTAEEKL